MATDLKGPCVPDRAAGRPGSEASFASQLLSGTREGAGGDLSVGAAHSGGLT